MAHNLEFNPLRGTTSFFSRKEKPWHGLGQVISQTVNPEEALRLANLDYQVELAPVFASFIPKGCMAVTKPDNAGFDMVDRKTNIIQSTLSKKGALVPDKFAVYRTDNLEILGTVGSKYTPVQNSSSIDFIYNIFKHNEDIKERNDIIIETAGALGKGERIFVTAKLPTGFQIGNEKDPTELYVVFTNSHDGTSSLTALITNIRVVCNNTLSAAMGNNKAKHLFRHTANIHNSMSEAMGLLKLAYKSNSTNIQAYNAMLNIKVDTKLVNDLIYKSMLNENQLLHINTVGFKDVSKDIISTRLKNQITDMQRFVDIGVGQEYNRGSLYWAYMGMNSYINNGSNFGDAEGKFNSLINGSGSKLDEKILNTCLTYI